MKRRNAVVGGMVSILVGLCLDTFSTFLPIYFQQSGAYGWWTMVTTAVCAKALPRLGVGLLVFGFVLIAMAAYTGLRAQEATTKPQ